MSEDEQAAVTAGESHYVQWGWSGCDGSAWRRLSQATRDGWEEAARAQARATAVSQKLDRCVGHLRAALGYADGERDAGIEALAVQVRAEVFAHATPEPTHQPPPEPSCAACDGAAPAHHLSPQLQAEHEGHTPPEQAANESEMRG